MQNVPSSSSLGLVGDLDDVDLLEDIEMAFGLRLADVDVERCWTVGDLFALVETQLPEVAEGGCATAMAFYRLRRYLQPALATPLRPSTPIKELAHVPVRRLHQIIVNDCGLRPPPEQLSVWGGIALVLVAGLPVAALLLGLGWWIAVLCTIPPFALFKLSPIRLPNRIKSFGDLTRTVASRSIGTLAHQGARVRPTDAWDAFKDVVSEHTALPKHSIKADTPLLAPSKLAS